METTTQFGANRTGVQSSPKDTKELLKATQSTVPSSTGDENALASVRLTYAREAEPLGSVPPPARVKGKMKSAGTIGAGVRPQVLVDKLAERLAFERSGTRLYEALIVKHAAYTDQLPNVSLEILQQFHAEEAQHLHLLIESLEQLGADPTAQTPCADLVGVEGMGLVQAITEPRTTFVQSLNAILIAELADNDGWQTLIAMARAAGQDELAERFTAALSEEDEHLRQVRAWMSELTMAELRPAVLS
jgi:bacterioferritin (cytochrome b1)